LPSREALRRFIDEQPGRVSKREIVRAFRLGAEHHAGLRTMLRALQAEGATEPPRGGRARPAGRLALKKFRRRWLPAGPGQRAASVIGQGQK